MKANETSIVRFLQQPDTQFVIPVYQRNYSWTEVQCRQLLEDIYDVASNEKIPSHFIGSLVYIHDDIFTTGTRYLTVIDGQQRLTTVTILWLVLMRKAKKAGNEKLSNEIYKKYLVNEFVEEEKLKLRPIKKDDVAFKTLLDNESENAVFTEYSQIVENYNYFYSKIPYEDIELLKNGISKLMFVEVSLERGKDDPQKIFQSLNSTGLDLSQGDLIRNYILMDLNPADQQKIYEKYWVYIEKSTTEKKSNFTKLSDFIRDYLTAKSDKIPNKDKVFESFKARYSFHNYEELEKLLYDLRKYAAIYNKLINPEEEVQPQIRQNLKHINKLEINVSYPFLLEVYKDYTEGIITDKVFVEILELIQSFVWRRFICNLPTNALNKIFLRLYEDIDRQNYVLSLQVALIKKRGTQRFPGDEEISAELKIKDVYNIQPKNRIYFLERLENYNNTEVVRLEDNDNITIEHILPQKPDNSWKIDLGDSLNELYKYVHTICNLTLSGNNGSLSNKSFREKRDMLEKGYKDSRLFLNKYLAGLDKWSIKEAEQRFEILLERFKQIWKYPNIKVEDLKSEAEINVFDIDNPTNKVIDYIIFFNEKIFVASFKDLQIRVATKIFEIDPSLFFTTDLVSKLKVTKDRNILSNPIKISELYYIESHGNAKQIINKVKAILESYKIYDELYIKFEDE